MAVIIMCDDKKWRQGLIAELINHLRWRSNNLEKVNFRRVITFNAFYAADTNPSAKDIH